MSVTERVDGTFLVAGGYLEPYAIDLVEIWDLDQGTTRLVSPLPVARNGHFAARLLDGRVAVGGGVNGLQSFIPLSIFDPDSEMWTDNADFHVVFDGTSYGDGIVMAGGSHLKHFDGASWTNLATGGSYLLASVGARVGVLNADRLAVWTPGQKTLDYNVVDQIEQGTVTSMAALCDGFVVFTTAGTYRVDDNGYAAWADLPVVGLQGVRLASGEIFATGGTNTPYRAFMLSPR